MAEAAEAVIEYALTNGSGTTGIWSEASNQTTSYDIIHPAIAEESFSQAVLMKILAPIACCIGACGAIVTLFILSQKKVPSTTNYYLMAMTTADLLFLVFLGTITILEEFDPAPMPYTLEVGKLQKKYNYDIYKIYGKIFLLTFLVAYEWVTAAMSFERCLVMCRPLTAQKYFTPARARLAIALIFLLSFVVETPRFAEYKLEKWMLGNDTITIVIPTDLNRKVMVVHRWIVDVAIMGFLPLLVTIISNFFVIRQVHKSNAYLSANLPANSNVRASVSREQRRVSLLLLAVAAAYIVGAAPFVTFMGILEVVPLENFNLNPSNMMTIMDVAIFLIAIRSIFIFAAFCWFSETFRQTCKGICPALKFTKKKLSSRRSSSGYELVHRTESSSKTRSSTMVPV